MVDAVFEKDLPSMPKKGAPMGDLKKTTSTIHISHGIYHRFLREENAFSGRYGRSFSLKEKKKI